MPDTPPRLTDEQVVLGLLLGRAVNMAGAWMAGNWAEIEALPAGDARNAAIGTFMLGVLERSGMKVTMAEPWATARYDQLAAQIHQARG